MTPQEWINHARAIDEILFVREGATHLAAALEEITRLRAEAELVVVPEFDASDALHFAESFENAGNLGGQAVFLSSWLAAEMRVNSVPASRVLKDGEWEAAGNLLFSARAACVECETSGECDMSAVMKAAKAWDAIRSQGKEGAT